MVSRGRCPWLMLDAFRGLTGRAGPSALPDPGPSGGGNESVSASIFGSALATWGQVKGKVSPGERLRATDKAWMSFIVPSWSHGWPSLCPE